MADDRQGSYAAATVRGAQVVQTQPHANAVRLVGDELEIGLSNGARVVIPVALIEGLAAASPEDRARIEISGVGLGLHWPDLDLDLTVPGLLAGVFGTEKWMNRQRAAAAGASVSEAKARAARSNGLRGGRPRKSPLLGA